MTVRPRAGIKVTIKPSKKKEENLADSSDIWIRRREESTGRVFNTFKSRIHNDNTDLGLRVAAHSRTSFVLSKPVVSDVGVEN